MQDLWDHKQVKLTIWGNSFSAALVSHHTSAMREGTQMQVKKESWAESGLLLEGCHNV